MKTRLRLPLFTFCLTLLCFTFSFEGLGQVTPPPPMDVVLVTYPFTGDVPNPVDVFSGLTATDFSLSAGTLSYGSAQEATWTGSGVPYAQGNSGWNQTNFNDGKFFAFTLQTDTADSFDLTSFSFFFRSTSAGPESITLLINGVEINTITGANSNTTTLHIEPLETPLLNNLTSAEVKIIGWNATTGTGDFRVDDVQLNGIVNLGSEPILISNPVTIENLNYFEFNGPSDSQSFELSGANLNGDEVTIALPVTPDFEISADDVTFFDDLSFPAYDGSATTIYVRLKDGLAINTYTDVITIDGGGADPITVDVSGEVQPEPVLGWQIETTNTDYIIDFDTTVNGVNEGQYDGTGFEPAPATGRLNSNAFAVTGWSDGDLAFGDTNILGDYARGNSTGGVGTGGLYAFEVAPGNRAFGFQPGGNDFAPGDVTLRLQNQTGTSIETMRLTYTVYVYNDQGRSNNVNLSYSGDNITFTPQPLLEVLSVETADASPEWVATTYTVLIGLENIADGDFYYLRWDSADISGSDSRDEFAIDDITLTANPDNLVYTESGSLTFTFYHATGSLEPGDDLLAVSDPIDFNLGDLDLGNITINPGADIALFDNLKIGGDLIINGSLTFMSNATTTGQLDEVPATSSILGSVEVQRYIPARRAFRLLSSAVTTSGSIRDNWQEGVNNPDTSTNLDPNNGFGTHITGSTTGANGFDATPSGNPSLFILNNTAQAWEAVANTNVNTLAAGTPYRMLVRGDRGINVTNNSATPTPTTLRATGELATGIRTYTNFSPVAGHFNFFGNPYQAAVNMNSLLGASQNLNTNQYYIWDPNLNTRGGYVTVELSIDPPAGTNTAGSAANLYLQPGQAAFVTTATDAAASITFQETHKAVSQPLTQVFNILSKIDLRLYESNSFADGGPVADGLGIRFSEDGDNGLTLKDAEKLFNIDENLAVTNNDVLLSIEHRSNPIVGESLPLFINQYRHTDYVFEAQLTELNDITALLRDHFTGIDTELENNESTLYAFNINPDDPQSSASDRFEIVFEELLSTNEVSFGNGFVLFPNPAQGEITLATKGITGEEVTLQITNVLGQAVYTATHTVNSNGHLTVDASTFSQGVYVLKLTHTKGTFTTKFIKK